MRLFYVLYFLYFAPLYCRYSSAYWQFLFATVMQWSLLISQPDKKRQLLVVYSLIHSNPLLYLFPTSI